jgi:hypothetical protein
VKPQVKPEPVKVVAQPVPVKPVPVKVESKVPVKPQVKPAPKVEPVKPVAKPAAKVDPIGAAIAAAKAKAAQTVAAQAAAKPSKAPAGGSKIGADFLKGAGASASGKAQVAPAAVAGPAVQAALKGAITRQLKPYWRVPQGVDTEQLVTVLRFSLNRDGTLAGPVVVVRQEGVNEANRAQAPLHKENAIRAVKLAAPFPLPDTYYDSWKMIEWNFNRNLAQ